MVAVIVLDAIDYSTVELPYKSIPLVLQDVLESFLNHLSLASLDTEQRDSTTASNMKDEGKRAKLRKKGRKRKQKNGILLTLHPYISIESLNTFPSILPAISTF